MAEHHAREGNGAKANIYAMTGNAINIFLLAMSAIYQIAIFGHGSGWWVLDSFGEHWAADGFCLSFKGTLVHTHLLCFYGDAVFALILLWLAGGKPRPELLLVKDGAKSVFFHGVAHVVLWVIEQKNGTAAAGAKLLSSSTTWPVILLSAVAIFAFWVAFLCAKRSPVPMWFNIAQSVLHTVMVLRGLPLLLVFSYANTVISFNIYGTNLVYGLEGERDIFYALSAIFVAVPILAATWAEPLSCDMGLVDYGGHILFDFTIPLSMIAYYAVASRMPSRRNDAKLA